MKGIPRRLQAIELTLTPQQVVLVWLRNALSVLSAVIHGGRKLSFSRAILLLVRRADAGPLC
jgi:hypothetical protein